MILIIWCGINLLLTVLLILATRRARQVLEVMDKAVGLQMDFLRDVKEIFTEEAEVWNARKELLQESQSVQPLD